MELRNFARSSGKHKLPIFLTPFLHLLWLCSRRHFAVAQRENWGLPCQQTKEQRRRFVETGEERKRARFFHKALFSFYGIIGGPLPQRFSRWRVAGVLQLGCLGEAWRGRERSVGDLPKAFSEGEPPPAMTSAPVCLPSLALEAKLRGDGEFPL